MMRLARSTFVFLLSAPLLLGAVASTKIADKKDIAPSRTVEVTTPVVVYQPSAVEQPATAVIPTEEETPTTPVPTESAALYEIDWYSINGGGTVNATSPSYQMGASIGQSVAGSASSPSYQMGIGFWYGAGSSGGCACDCHGNPVCDGAICDVLDVVSAVTVAFRNGAALPDPNANCPYEKTDVDCSTFTDVIDVVKIVTVAFRNGNPATEFCNPCP